MDVNGARVLVTGASRGIGRALAEKFAARGARVVLLARSTDQIADAARQLGGEAYAADLTDPAQLRGLVAAIEDDAGPLDVLVNNAGMEAAGSLVDLSADDLEAVYRLNLLAPVELCRQVLPGMLARGRGHIVAVSSLAGVATIPGLAAYASSKAGLTHVVSGIRADLRGAPVGTTVVETGPVATQMIERAREYAPTRDAFDRLLRFGLLRQITATDVARETVAAVQAGRRHVRLPKRAALSAALTEAPRRASELLLTGVRHQERS